MNSNLLDLALKLKKFNESFDNKKNRIIALNTIFNSKFLFLEHFLTKKDFFESPYRNLLINYFKNSENQFPGSSYDISVGISKKILGNYKTTEKIKTDNNLESAFRFLRDYTNEENFDLFKEILIFGGPDASITCNETKNSEISIEKYCIPVFDIKLKNELIPIYFNTVQEITKDVIFSVVDGYIERESELVPLIEKSKSDNLPVVVICRGISDEATKHLKQILLRNNIKMYVYIEKFNDKDPFLFDDISIAAKTEKVSGETLDSIYRDTVSKCSLTKVKISATKIKFLEENKELINQINDQIKIAKVSNPNALDYLIKRKSRVSPNNVVVNIPNKDINKLLEIKNLIKVYNRIAAHGMFIDEKEKINSCFKDQLVNRLVNSLYNNIAKIGYSIKLGEKNEV